MNRTMFRDLPRCSCGEEIQIGVQDNHAEGRMEIVLRVHDRYAVRHVDHAGLFSAQSAEGVIRAEAYKGAMLLRRDCPCRIDFSAVTDTSRVHQAAYEKIEVTDPVTGRRFYHAVRTRPQQVSTPIPPASIKPALPAAYGKPVARRLLK